MVKLIPSPATANGRAPASTNLPFPLLPDIQNADLLLAQKGSDSSSLDNMLELFLAGGMDLFRAMRLLVPPAWQGNKVMDDDLKAFYEFNYRCIWYDGDGPAGYRVNQRSACGL